MRNKWLAISLALTFGLIFSISAAAQDQGAARGNLGGIVYDASKASVPGAQVTITGPIGSLSQSTTDEGSFLFSTLIPGIYSVKVQKPGFKVASVKSAEVQINKTTSIEVILETGQVSETVEVSAATVTVDTSTSAVTANISDTFFENIPVQRGVANLFYLSPGAVDGIQTGGNNPSISGSSGLENSYIADGVSINDQPSEVWGCGHVLTARLAAALTSLSSRKCRSRLAGLSRSMGMPAAASCRSSPSPAAPRPTAQSAATSIPWGCRPRLSMRMIPSLAE